MLSLGVCCFSPFQWYQDTLSSTAEVNCSLKCRTPLFNSRSVRMLRQSTYRSLLSALRVFHPHPRNPSRWHPPLNPIFKNAFSKRGDPHCVGSKRGRQQTAEPPVGCRKHVSITLAFKLLHSSFSLMSISEGLAQTIAMLSLQCP